MAGVGGHAAEEVRAIVVSMPAMPSSTSVTWPQRVLLIGVVASVLAIVTGAVPPSITTSTTPSLLLWSAVALNALLLLGLGTTAVVTTRRWFRQRLPHAQLRRQRRGVRRRAVLLGLIAYVAHQALVVLLDPRFSLERLAGRRRVFPLVVAVPDRLELAWAFTAVALGHIVLAWLLWRSAAVSQPVPSDSVVWPTVVDRACPLAVEMPPARAIEPLPRDPVTGRVVRQFDL